MLFLEDQIHYNYENFENSSNSTMPRPKKNKRKGITYCIIFVRI
jgi:hypothetical protein